MSETVRLKFPYIAASQLSKNITHNMSLDRLDLLVQCTVLDRDLSTPPGSPTNGAAYLIASSPTGAWTGHANHLTIWETSQWHFQTPVEGFRCWVADENIEVLYDGAAWNPTTLGMSGASAFTDLSDVPASYTGEALKTVRVNAGETGLEFTTATGGASDFTDLGDVPGSYAGASLQSVRVKSDESGLEFADYPTGGGGGGVLLS